MFSSNTTQVSDGGYQISRSLRFNSADSAYLNRTPASATNRRTWTLSTWAKVSAFGSQVFILGAGVDGDNRTDIRFDGDSLQFVNNVANVTTANLKTTAVYRDPSAWYHIVIAVDSTQATSTNRIKIYVNGVQVTDFATATYFSQNTDTFVNNNCGQTIGRYSITSSNYFNGYMTEFNLIDGQQLTPSSFGETDTQTGVWKPKAYSGSYGTNGFYLNFSDNSNTTAATLGKDYSGNGNNWTPNNFSVTAGAGNDSLVDSPTSYGTDTGVGGTVRGNYCTLNPLSNTSGTWSNGNLQFVGPNGNRRSNSTIAVSTGQWYWEVTLGNAPATKSNSSDYNSFGFGLSTVFGSATSPSVQTDALTLSDNAYYKNFSGASTDSGTTFASGDVLSIAVDLDANTFTFRKNNSSLVTGTIGGTVGRELTPIIISYSGDFGVMYANFGQRPFAYTAPSGFKALCTQNLPTPTIGATTATVANKYFDVSTWSGTGSNISVTNSGGFQPDWVWAKSRSNAGTNNILVDAVRGINYWLASDSTSNESGLGSPSPITAFNSNGFSGDTSISGSGRTYVGWQWKANGSGSTNTAGQITSTVSASTTSGFSVVTFTADGTTKTVGHGLGVKPSLVIVKGRNSVGSWIAMTDIINGSMQYGALNSTAAFASISYSAPTSTVFQYNDNNGNTQVAYCFASIDGYSKIGTYTGNSSADGPFVFTGMRPAYLLVKNATSSGDWIVVDAKRNTYNMMDSGLQPNGAYAEASNQNYRFDFLSNGFKVRTTNLEANQSGNTIIFMAFAESPFKYSLAR